MKIIILSVLLLFTTNLHAASLSAGLGTLIKRDNLDKNDESHSGITYTFYPSIFFNKGPLSIRGYQANLSLMPRNKVFDFGLKATYAGEKYSNQYISKRRQTVFTGVYGRLFFLFFSAMKNISSEGAGVLGDVFMVFPIRVIDGFWTMIPRIGFDYFSRDYVNNYYGVTAAEAVEFPEYQVRKGGANQYLALGNILRFGESFRARITFTYKYVGEAVANSPIVRRNGQISGNIMLMYKFF